MDQNILYQANMTTMRLEVNGDFSSSKRAKNIKAKLFFIKDKVEDGDIELEYYPTEKILSDVLNKPKQGAYFRLDCSHLQNVPVEYDNKVECKQTHPFLLPN